MYKTNKQNIDVLCKLVDKLFFRIHNGHTFLHLVPRNQLLSVAAACKVLIEFSLLRLENPDEACAVSQVSQIKSFDQSWLTEDSNMALLILEEYLTTFNHM